MMEDVKRIGYILLILLSGAACAEEDTALDQCLADPSHAVYRMFQTKNIWTFLKLDTRSGLVWQVQWGNNAMSIPVNSTALVPPQERTAGRFVLCATKNIFNFILLDQEAGRMWNVQWSQDDTSRYTIPIDTLLVSCNSGS